MQPNRWSAFSAAIFNIARRFSKHLYHLRLNAQRRRSPGAGREICTYSFGTHRPHVRWSGT